MSKSRALAGQNSRVGVQKTNKVWHGLCVPMLICIFVLVMTNEEYILLHRRDDVRTLALRRAEEGVEVKWCLQQIEGWQKACEKLPRWSQVDGLWYPPALSMEQCSSELTARYKATIVSRLFPECS